MLGLGHPRPRRLLRSAVATLLGIGVLVPATIASATPDEPAPPTSEAGDPTSPASTESTVAPDETAAPTTEAAAPSSTEAPTPTTLLPTTTAPEPPPAPTTTTTGPAPVEADAVSCLVPVVLTWADTGPFVTCLKTKLLEVGYAVNNPLDYYDLTTVNAIKAFQTSKGLPATGIANPQTTWRLGIWQNTTPAGCQVYGTLRVGALMAPVQCLEFQLAMRGYGIDGPNQYYDNSTVLAVQAFQRSIGLPADGVADAMTLHRLGLRPAPPAPPAPPPPPCKLTAAVKLRDYGEPVRCVEARLIAIGYSIVGGANLYYANETFLAVQAYQRAVGLSADGIAGSMTLYKLGLWGGPPPNPYGLPGNSGSGRRVVYSRSQQRVWAVDANGVVVKTHLISGRLYEPRAGTYSVYSKSMYTYSTANPAIKWRYMVRFAYGNNGGRIGFHEIPKKNGVPLQSVSQLGQPLSGGCVRQSTPDAQWMWNWAYVGTKVVVL